jgi:sulfide:quinone oxidoreductase
MMAAVEPRHAVSAGKQPARLRVVIAGAGAAGAEAALALHRIAGSRVATTIVAPEERFVHFPPAALAPFAFGAAEHIPLAELARLADATFHPGTVAAVDPESRTLELGDGTTLTYEALLIAVGAVPHAPFRRALTFGAPGSDERMHGLIQDLEDGYVHRIAFVVPPDTSWPLPVYELALLTAERAYEMCANVTLTLVTPEAAPLEVLGPRASREVARWLSAADVAVRTGVAAEMEHPHTLALGSYGDYLRVDRIVTVPLLHGPAIRGLPHDDFGFLPVDGYCRVVEAPDVFAAGDATDFPVKHGSIACRQADAAAESFAARAGVAIEPEPFAPILGARLVTDRHTLSIQRDLERAVDIDDAESAHLGRLRKPAGRELSRLLRQP